MFAKLAMTPSIPWNANTKSRSALTTASTEMKWINGWSAAATFDGEFSKVTTSYAGSGMVRYVSAKAE